MWGDGFHHRVCHPKVEAQGTRTCGHGGKFRSFGFSALCTNCVRIQSRRNASQACNCKLSNVVYFGRKAASLISVKW